MTPFSLNKRITFSRLHQGALQTRRTKTSVKELFMSCYTYSLFLPAYIYYMLLPTRLYLGSFILLLTVICMDWSRSLLFFFLPNTSCKAIIERQWVLRMALVRDNHEKEWNDAILDLWNGIALFFWLWAFFKTRPLKWKWICFRIILSSHRRVN